MKQYNRADHDKKEVKLRYVGLASVVERIHEETGLDWLDFVNDGNLGPEERELFDQLCVACGLTDKQRNALLLHYFDHYTQLEIAAKFGVCHKTVFQYIRGGKSKLYPTLKALVDAKDTVK